MESYFAADGNTGSAENLLVLQNSVVDHLDELGLMEFVDDLHTHERNFGLAAMLLLHDTLPLIRKVAITTFPAIRSAGKLEVLSRMSEAKPDYCIVFGNLPDYTEELEDIQKAISTGELSFKLGSMVSFYPDCELDELSGLLTRLENTKKHGLKDDESPHQLQIELFLDLNQPLAFQAPTAHTFLEVYEKAVDWISRTGEQQGGTRE